MARSAKMKVFGGMLVLALVCLQARQVRSILAQSHPLQLIRGAAAPALEFADADGTPIPPSEFRGHPLVVSFWAAWCAPCRKELPELGAMVDSWNAKAPAADRVVFVAVNAGDDPRSVSMFVEDRRLRSARFTFDPAGLAVDRWKIRAFPTTFFIDRSGGVQDIQEGYDAGFSIRLEALLRDESRTAARP